MSSQVHISKDSRKDAITRLSAEFRPSLLRYFSRRVKETHEIEDLVQEVFYRLVRRTAAGDIEVARAYIFETASSVLNDWLRKRQVRHADKHDEFTENSLDDEVFSPERVLVSKGRLAEATAIIMKMPERTRTIFVLRRLEGLKYKDIATRLGLSVSAVEKHMRKAVEFLTDRLDRE